MADPSAALTYSLDGDVAVVTMDDGKANAMGHGLIEALTGALERAEGEAGALVLVGGPKVFCAGFDLGVMTESTEAMRALVTAGGRFWMRLYGSPLPTVAACTGHALAGGAVTLLSVDDRIGPADSPAKIGLSEVSIGMPLPIFAVELARARLAPPHLTPAVLGAVHGPEDARAAGYLDRLVPRDEVVATAVALGRERAALRRGAVARTKAALRGATIDHVLATLDDDIASLTGPDPAT